MFEFVNINTRDVEYLFRSQELTDKVNVDLGLCRVPVFGFGTSVLRCCNAVFDAPPH